MASPARSTASSRKPPAEAYFDYINAQGGVYGRKIELKALEAQGLYPVANRPDEFAAQIKRESAVWARVIQETGIKPE